MEFFDQKQEVIDVKLTTYGRHLLSQGRLMPVYYAFFDDDIIYDNSYFFKNNLILADDQNQIQDRILDGTIRVKQQSNFSGIESNIKKQIKAVKSQYTSSPGSDLIAGTSRGPGDISMQHELERDYTLGMPLGKTTIENDLPPSFRLLMLAGEIDSHKETYEAPDIGSVIRIPQLDINITYDITAHFIDKEDQASLRQLAEKRNKEVDFSPIFPDGSYLKFEGNHALIMLEEMNVDLEKDSFEIEVFEEVIETKRQTKLDDQGVAYTEKVQVINYKPIFFDPGNIETFMGDSEDGSMMTEEDVTPPMDGSVGSIFTINADEELSVPLGLLKSVLHSPAELSAAIQKRDSTLLRKPVLNVSSSGIGADDGPLSSLERDIYFTGVSNDDPEECD